MSTLVTNFKTVHTVLRVEVEEGVFATYEYGDGGFKLVDIEGKPSGIGEIRSSSSETDSVITDFSKLPKKTRVALASHVYRNLKLDPPQFNFN